MKIVNHGDLDVYQRAFTAATTIFRLSKGFPKEEQYALTDQIRRSSRAVCANLAEAWRRRRYEQAFINRLSIAEGEAAETQVYLVAARSLVGEGQTSAAFPFTDDLSGFHDALMVFNPIVGTTQSASTQPNASHLVTGTLADGIYVSTLTLPQYAAEGRWTLTALAIVDQVGNRDYFEVGSNKPPPPYYFVNVQDNATPTPIETVTATPTATPTPTLSPTSVPPRDGILYLPFVHR
jgi:four helix bundle protein